VKARCDRAGEEGRMDIKPMDWIKYHAKNTWFTSFNVQLAEVAYVDIEGDIRTMTGDVVYKVNILEVRPRKVSP
jgi:hypothetical protein